MKIYINIRLRGTMVVQVRGIEARVVLKQRAETSAREHRPHPTHSDVSGS